MATRTNPSLRIAVVVLVIVAAGAVCLVAAVAELGNVRAGIDEGFPLRGTYQEGGLSLIVGYDAENAWLLQDQPARAETGGTLGRTADPNVWLLLDADGAEVGWAHLAYANAKGEGTVYVRFGSDGVTELRKVDRVPGVVAMG